MKNTIYRILLALLAVIGSNSGAVAQDTVVSQKNEYYVVIAARSPHLNPLSIGGHAFMTWGIRNSGDSILAIQTLGFFPGEGSSLIDDLCKTRPGRIKKGYLKNSNRQFIRQMIVKLDFETWKTSLDSAWHWDRHAYNLFRTNCLTFLDSIADQISLTTPTTRYAGIFPKIPYKYIRQLRKKNKDLSVKNLKVFYSEDGIWDEIIADKE